MGKEVNWLSIDTTPAEIETILRACNVLRSGEIVMHLTPAGSGNMNCVLRITTSMRTLVVKQSRPWVEKYPTLAAPVERIQFETRFYQVVTHHSHVSAHVPQVLGSLPELYILVLEDLGSARDATMFYQEIPSELDWHASQQRLVGWLAALHRIPPESMADCDFSNRALRELNHAHLFEIPFADPPALNLDTVTPGLAAVAAQVGQQKDVVGRCAELGEIYLADGPTLLHGDFFPGSWLITERGEFIIDPEFCFRGCREFDLGVMLAHCRLIDRHADARRLVQQYESATDARVDIRLVQDFAAVEILRRLLGVAQLPLMRTLADKRQYVAGACESLVRG